MSSENRSNSTVDLKTGSSFIFIFLREGLDELMQSIAKRAPHPPFFDKKMTLHEMSLSSLDCES